MPTSESNLATGCKKLYPLNSPEGKSAIASEPVNAHFRRYRWTEGCAGDCTIIDGRFDNCIEFRF